MTVPARSLERVRALLASALLAAAGPFVASPAGAQTATSDEIHGVVELFTAQGCASCPPAERVLADLADETGILALAYHVDYWDYIGWSDTYGSHANTARQRAYAKAFKTSMLYTPQAVVNGVAEMVGSHEGKLRAALSAGLDTEGRDATVSARFALGGNPPASPPPRLVLRRAGDMLRISALPRGVPPGSEGPAAPPAATGPPPVLLLVTFDDRAEVPVSEGENAGHTLVNAHAVRDWRVLGTWRGEPMEVSIPLALLSDAALAGTGCAAILQATSRKGKPGRILAAAKLEFTADEAEPDAP